MLIFVPYGLVTEGKLIERKGVSIDNSQMQAQLIILPKIEAKVHEPEYMRNTLKGLFDEFEIRSVWEEQLDEFAGEVEKEAHI